MVGGPRAVGYLTHAPEGGSAGPSCLACPVRSFIILPLLLSLRLESAACHACDCALSSLSSHRSLVSLSLPLSLTLSLSPCTCTHARCERTHTRTEWHARWNDILDTVMACSMHTVTRRRGRRRGRRRRGRQRARDARSRARARGGCAPLARRSDGRRREGASAVAMADQTCLLACLLACLLTRQTWL